MSRLVNLRAPRDAARLALLAGLVLVVAALGPASAAGLELLARPGGVYASTDARCSDGPVEVAPSGPRSPSGTFQQVTVSGVDAGCASGEVAVYASAAPRTVAAVGSGAVTGTTLVVATDPFTPPVTGSGAAWVHLDGWPVAASWSYTPPPPSGPVTPGPGVQISEPVWTLVTNNPVQACFTTTVSTTSTTPVTWGVRLDLTKPPFNGATNGFQVHDVGGSNIAYRLRIDYDIPGMVATVRGDASLPTITAGQTLRFSVCNYGLPPGVQTPSAYTVEITPGTGSAWSGSKACYSVTVRGNGTSRFYFAYQFELDMAAARARVGGGTRFAVDSGDDWKFTTTRLGTNVFRFSSNSPANIAGTETYGPFVYCAYRY